MIHRLACALALATTALAAPVAAQVPFEPAPEADAAATSTLVVDGDVFAGFQTEATDAESSSEFVLDRAELGAAWLWQGRFGTELRLEGVRSAGPNSAFGVAGDSVLLRVKRAHAFATVDAGPGEVVADAGMVMDAWVGTLLPHYDHRGLSPLVSQQMGLFDDADLGGTVGWRGFDRRVSILAQMTNGEGRTLPEQNTGKNLTLVASGTPVAVSIHRGEIRVGLHAVYRQGSVGIGSARDHRYGGALTLQFPCPQAGVEYVRALGYAGEGDREATAIGAWASSWLGTHWAGLALRFDQVNTDTALDDAVFQRTTLSAFSDLLDPARTGRANLLRVYAGVELDRYGADAGPVPGAASALDTTRFFVRAVVRARGTIVLAEPISSPLRPEEP